MKYSACKDILENVKYSVNASRARNVSRDSEGFVRILSRSQKGRDTFGEMCKNIEEPGISYWSILEESSWVDSIDGYRW